MTGLSDHDGVPRLPPPSGAPPDEGKTWYKRWWAITLSALGGLVFLGAVPPAPDEDTVVLRDDSEEPEEAIPPPASPTPPPSPSPSPSPSPVEDSEREAAQAEAPAVDGELRVHFLDVGQGDAALLVAEDAAVLIDTGRHDRSDVMPHLQRLGIKQLDVLAVTHAHADHLGQFDAVMDTVDVDEVWWSSATHTTQTFERAVAALEASDAAFEEPHAGDSTTVGGMLFEVVNPGDGADFGDLHDSGLAFRGTYGDVRFLFTGDAEAATESRMVGNHGEWLAADIYQVGHHGSRTSTSQAMLDAVAPKVAVWSAGEGNQYGHPHAEVVQRLEGAGLEVYGTATHGTVTVVTDGATYTVQTDGNTPADTGPASRPAPEPAPAPPPPPVEPAPGNCHPSYPDVCIPPPPPDLNCGDVPHRRFRVIGDDPHGFDGNNDGVGCES